MELLNTTEMVADYTQNHERNGRERIIVVVKGTFSIPNNNEEPRLKKKQIPLVMVDKFTGEPGKSATLYESEFVPFKPRCDVILNGSAYAAKGKKVKQIDVLLRVGKMSKNFYVFGNRHWQKGIMKMKISEPEPFAKQPISYDFAYGGVNTHPDNPEKIDTYMKNPIGVGYYPYLKGKQLEGKILPNTSQKDNPISNKKGDFEPMSFGSIGRNFQSRIKLAGTYDQKWHDDVFPFLPSDFSTGYYQSAPEDQQIKYPQGGEKIVLKNLSHKEIEIFKLPTQKISVKFYNIDLSHEEVNAKLDTILIEPDQKRFFLIWRASHPLRRGMLEIARVTVDKTHYGI